MGLGRQAPPLAADLLELPADGQAAAIEIDVLPAQAQPLALAQPQGEHEGEERSQPVLARAGQEALRLLRRPGAGRRRGDAERAGERRRVAGDQAVARGVSERPAQHSARVLGCARCQPAIEEFPLPALDGRCGERRQALPAQRREDVEPGELGVGALGRGVQPRRARLQPLIQVLPDGELFRGWQQPLWSCARSRTSFCCASRWVRP